MSLKNKVDYTFAQRTDWFLEPNVLINEHKNAIAENRTIVDLTLSNPTQCGFDYSVLKLDELRSDKGYCYSPESQGLEQARISISDYYQKQNLNVNPNNIFLTASTSEGYSNIFRLLCNPRDSVLFPQPSYPLFRFLTDLADVNMDFYSLTYNEEWVIDFNSLSKRLNESVKAVCLVNPNNPTGSYFKKREYASFVEMCCNNNSAIISDEVFWDYPLSENNDRMSLLGNKKCLTFVLGGLSKTLGFPQMKLSWIIIDGPKDLVAEAKNRLEIISDTYLSVNTPTQNALGSWLVAKDDIQSQLQKRIKKNYQTLKECMRDTHFSVFNCEGGWYAILKMPQEVDEEAVCLSLLKNQDVYVHPGYFYDFIEEECMVLSLLPQTVDFQKGVDCIREELIEKKIF